MDTKQILESRQNHTGERVFHFFKKAFGDSFEVVAAREETTHPLEKLYFKEIIVISHNGHKVRVEWVAQSSPFGLSTMAHWRVMYGRREKMVYGNTVIDEHLQRLPDYDNPPSVDDMRFALDYVTASRLNNFIGWLGLTRYVLPIVSEFERRDLYSFLLR